MNLTKLNVESTLRITMDNIDEQVDLMRVAVVDPNMYKLLFFDLPFGNTLGKDDPSGIRTGFKAQIYDVDTSTSGAPTYETDLTSLDWFEDENYYFAQALTAKVSISVTTDKYISFVRVVYQGSDGAETPAAILYDIFESTAAGSSKLAVSNGGTPPKTGLKVEAAQTPLAISCSFLFKIAK